VPSDGIYIFLCNKDSRSEVLSKMLVGTGPDDWKRDFQQMNIGDHVLVFDYTDDANEFIGPFRVVKHSGGKPIDICAWGGKFRAQARIESAGVTKVIELQKVTDKVGSTNILRQSSMPLAWVCGDTAALLREMFGFPATPTPSPPSDTSQPHGPTPKCAAQLYKTVQGFSVRSKAERDIANLLDRLGILCHYERPIPGGGGYLCDFFLPQHDVYIEYWGLQGDAGYDNTRKVKTRVYNKNGLRLLELEPADEGHLETRLKQELRRFGIDADAQEPRGSTGGWLARLLRRIRRWLNR